MGGWENFGVELLFVGDFLVGFFGVGIDVGQIDVKNGFGSGWFGWVEIQLGGKFVEFVVY